MKLLLVDDDPGITQLVSRRLKQDNYVVEVATDGECAIDLLEVSPYSLILLDLKLPKLNGFEVCQTLRNRGDTTPVLMLTGQDDLSDKVAGLDVGADDYLVKPFELDELTARVRALLRRNSEVSTAVIRCGPLQFDAKTQTLTVLGQEVSLRSKELAILELMLRYPSQIFEPDTIIERLWDLADCPGTATVKAHICSLRKQLEAVGVENAIETVYGKGYRLNQDFLVSTDPSNSPQALPESRNSPLDNCNQTLINDTWEQVQLMSWHRLSSLNDLVTSWSRSVAGNLDQKAGASDGEQDRQVAIDIAHQLKGTLGSFGFQATSLQAAHVEDLLSGNGRKNVVDPVRILDEIQILQRLLRQHMTQGADLPGVSRLPCIDVARVLLVARDQAWAQNLWQQAQDAPFHVELCTHLNVTDSLLKQSPTVILLELSQEERSLDLSLLDALVSNYQTQVPILAIIESQQPDEQLVAIHHGASAIALKNWSTTTLLNIIAEYTQPTQQPPQLSALSN